MALGAVAWVSGQPFVFPSLGPSAFLLAFERRGSRERLSRVVAVHGAVVAEGERVRGSTRARD